MFETSKAMKRRFNDGAFHQRFFVGRGIDVGAGPDGISQYQRFFPSMLEVHDWDRGDGDAQELPGVEPESFDWLASSHCLEHLNDPYKALERWIEAVKPGGHLIIVVPDEDMYEAGTWPSTYGEGHQWSFTVSKSPMMPKSINILDLVVSVNERVSLERLYVIRDFFHEDMIGDQTRMPNTESAIEFVLRKYPR